MFLAAIGERGDMLFRHDQEMHRRSRLDVVESDDVIIFVEDPGRNFPSRNLAKNTIVHDMLPESSVNCHLPMLIYFYAPAGRLALSSRPDRPSRRASSSSTSCGSRSNCASMTIE